MADNTDTTRPGEAEAVEAGLEVLGPWPRSLERQMARVTVDLLIDAVYPVIAAAVREQAARDIGRDYIAGSRPGVYSVSQHNDDVLAHQRIVRGGR